MITSVLLAIFLVVSLVFKQSPLDGIKNLKNEKSLNKRSMILGLIALYGIFMSFSEYKEIAQAETELAQCLTSDAKMCKDVNYNIFFLEFESGPRAIIALINNFCGVDEITCLKLKERDIKRSIA